MIIKVTNFDLPFRDFLSFYPEYIGCTVYFKFMHLPKGVYFTSMYSLPQQCMLS